VRALAVGATIIVSFTYVVAQIYAVGLIASRFTGVDFSVGIFLGLASILVCSFLGGMRAITWTQVAQYIIILVAFLIPTMWLSAKHSPAIRCRRWPTVRCCPSWREREAQLAIDPREEEVRARFRSAPTNSARGWPACRIPGKPARSRPSAASTRRALRNASLGEIRSAERALVAYPRTADEAARVWAEQRSANLARAPPEPHATPFPGDTAKNRTSAATTSWRWCSA
jgi:cation/acetate symporter